MAIHTNAGSRLFISPTSVNVDTINGMTDVAAVAFFEAIVDWVEVEELEDLGELGDSSEGITFTSLKNSRVRKLKGPRDAGTQAVVVGRDPLDDGQEELIAAERTKFDFPIKIELSDARTESYAKSVMYYAGMVQAAPTNLGNVSNVVRRNFSIGINTAVFEVAGAVAVAPTNTLLPSISGIAQVGRTLTAIEGTWTGAPAFTYQWQVFTTVWGNISGATAKTYVPVTGNVGNPLRVIVTGTNAAGATPATSGATAAVIAA